MFRNLLGAGDSVSLSDVLGVIPARYGSSRFPGKLLARLDGKSILEHVYERTWRSRCFARVVVATDSEQIEAEARAFGADVRRSLRTHRCGLERVAEVAEGEVYPIVCDIQADQPLIPPEGIAVCVQRLLADEACEMATVATPVESREAYRDPNIVKTIVDRAGNALYFSRTPIPFAAGQRTPRFLKHHGVYCFRRDVLLSLGGMERSRLEIAEDLEQLRALEQGIRIAVAETSLDWEAVNAASDLKKLEQVVSAQTRT